MPDQPKKILIAEDEKPMANALKFKLTKAGFDVFVAFNGQEALDLIKKEKIDLALIDLIMPVLDGFGLLKKIKEQNIKVPVVVLSNLSQEQDAKKAKEFGAKDYFVKSNTPIIEIVNYVKKFFNK